MLKKIQNTANFIKSKTSINPEICIILGTGLGGLVSEITDSYSINYADIPDFPVSTVKGHQGKLIFGILGGKSIVAMQGRFHFYEGYSMKEVTFPIRVMKAIGVEKLIVSNAAGGMNPEFSVGDMMIINDHINLMGTNPLIGHNYEELGPRFPDMSEPYSKIYIEKAKQVAKKLKINIKEGVYAAVTGPTFETPAEYCCFRTMGADAVGMSTVPEVIVAKHAGMSVFAISVISDLGGMEITVPVSHEEVLEAANNAEPKMTAVIKNLIPLM